MASAFISSILSKTSQVLGSVRRWAASPSSSSDPRSSVLKDLEELERTLKRIQAVLHDAEEREIRDESVKLWLKELKEVAYDAEDVLDEYHYEELRALVEGRASRKRKRVEGDDDEEVSGSLSTIVVSIPDGMGDRIREIRQKFDEISEDRERLRLREEDGERRVFGALCAPPSSHMVDESSIYGREGDKQKVIDLLFSEGMGINGISVIPIVGKGGLGKTTIAQLVYNDSKVKERFDLTGWVCISDDFDVPRITKAIIESLTKISWDLTQLSTIQDTLEEKVKGKRVLLVLDDVWNEQQSRWESLRIPFVGAEMVRIIVTCRNDSVARIMQTVHPYHPGYLSEDESWSLFKHYAFAGRDPEEQSRLADIGKKIVKKCSGLPLAVKTIGSLLRHEIDEDSWMEVLQSGLWEDENNETLASLRLSYNRMPAHLKPCFVYCSMFPKDYVFDRDVLVRLWMAQGYILPRGRSRPEDMGDEYLNDLQRRSLFDSFDARLKMHDMIHDLAKSIAGNEFYTIVDKKLRCSPNEVRHLYMEDARELVKPLDWYNFRALRTLLLRYTTPVGSQDIIHFPLLRCLKLCLEKKDETSNLLRNLKHLRYLHIQSSYICWLPKFVCLPYHLQTLILCCDELAELPDGLGSLTNLRHLDIQSRWIKRLPESICLLYHLQTLILCCDYLAELPDGLGSLTNLRHLDIQSIYIWRLPESICLLYHLQTLILCCQELRELPAGLGSLTNLRDFKLQKCCIGRLPESVCQLCNLQTLDLHWCNRLKKLPSGIGSLTKLRRLGTLGPQILCLPAGIGKLTNLQRLHGRYEVQGGIGVLKDLVNLQGDLCISGLRNLVSIEDAKDVGLKYKHKLERLYLFWDADCKNDWHYNCDNIGLDLKAFLKDVPGDEKREEALLEYLQPPTNLKKLLINGYGGSKFPKWVGNLLSFASLQEIHLIGCQNVRSLPLYIHVSLGKLDASISKSMLERVYISGCRQLKSIAGLHNFHSLKNLQIYNCPQLQLLSEEGLPSKLQYLYIKDCQQLTLLPGMQNLTSLGDLAIINCPQLQLLSEEGLPSKLESLCIENCQQLMSLSGMQNLASLRVLALTNCAQLAISSVEELPSILQDVRIEECQQLISLRLLSEEGLPSKLKSLYIENCWQLTSLSGMQNLTSLGSLIIKNCPKLQIMAEDQLSSIPNYVDIINCPGLGHWCQIQKINCIQVALGNKLTISNTWENIKQGFDDVTSTDDRFDESSTSRVELLQPRSHLSFSNFWESFIERLQAKPHRFDDLTSIVHLRFSNSWKLFLQTIFKSIPKELTIWGCTHIPPIRSLPTLASLQRLVIKDCPGIHLVTDELLPFSLKSLVVDSCEDLRSLQLMQRNRHAFKELRIVNCPKLATVKRLNRPFFPKFLTIEQCPQLLLSDDWRPFISPCAENAGELEMEFYPPHSEEAENKETIDEV